MLYTEHMFFDEKRIPYVRQMILAESLSERESVLAVNIRLLDPPLHEFLPKMKQEIQFLKLQTELTNYQKS
ncbi:phosphate dikinase [Listeria monocytogenes]|nr:phosphate dikinase [Listeria monocytogenes]